LGQTSLEIQTADNGLFIYFPFQLFSWKLTLLSVTFSDTSDKQRFESSPDIVSVVNKNLDLHLLQTFSDSFRKKQQKSNTWSALSAQNILLQGAQICFCRSQTLSIP